MGGNKGRDIREVSRTARRGSKKRTPGKGAKGSKRRKKRSKPKTQKRRGRANPRALSLADLERGLRAAPAGADLSLADIERDLEAGFQPNSDGTIDLVRYVAWLLRRHGYGKES